MKTTTFVLALAAAATLSAPVAREARAAYAGIQKCTAPDGTAVYTDVPCTQIGASPAAFSTELDLRLSSERSRMLAADPSLASTAPLGMQTRAGAGRRSLAAGCARSATQLAMDVQASMSLGDVNRLAESYHWVGMSHRESLPVMQRLERMTHARVIAAQVYGGGTMGLQFADASGEMHEPQAGTLLLTVQDDGAQRSLELNVQQYAGCYFMRF